MFVTCQQSLWRSGDNSLVPGKFEWNFKHVIFKQIFGIDDRGISCEFTLIRMSLDFTDDQSILLQVMAWCRQATSHYLSQCWPRSLSLYGVTMPQWIDSYWVNNYHSYGAYIEMLETVQLETLEIILSNMLRKCLSELKKHFHIRKLKTKSRMP